MWEPDHGREATTINMLILWYYCCRGYSMYVGVEHVQIVRGQNKYVDNTYYNSSRGDQGWIVLCSRFPVSDYLLLDRGRSS